MRDDAFGNPCNILFYVILCYFVFYNTKWLKNTGHTASDRAGKAIFCSDALTFHKPFIYALIRQGIGVALCEYASSPRRGAVCHLWPCPLHKGAHGPVEMNGSKSGRVPAARI